MVCLATYVREFLLNTKFENNYLEIGIFDGEVISHVAETYSDKKCYGIDPFIEDGNTSWITQRQKGERLLTCKDNCSKHKNISIYEMTSEDFYKQLTDEQIYDLNIGCVVIDGEHSASAVKNDIQLALKLLAGKNGLIIIDDWLMDCVHETALSELPDIEHIFIGDKSACVFFLRK
jgi:hypothetical protein